MAGNGKSVSLDPAQPWVGRAKQYRRKGLRLDLLTLAGSVVFWAAGAAVAWPAVNWLSAAIANRWLTLLAWAGLLGAARIILFAPLEWLQGYHLEHEFELSNETAGGWLWRQVKAALVGLVIGMPMLLAVFWLLWFAGSWWPLYLFIGAFFFSVVLARVFPVWILPLFYKSEPIDDPELLNRLERLAEGAGLNISGVYRLGLSRTTRKANAALAGIGRSRRVLLGDTLLENMNQDEVAAVFAHELGHHVLGHIHKGLVIGTAGSVLSIAIVWLMMEPVRVDWPSTLARLPLLALVLTAVGMVVQPAGLWLSRRWEWQADRFALARIGSAEPFISAMMRLAELNLADPSPPRWIETVFYSHPSIGRRVGEARQSMTG